MTDKNTLVIEFKDPDFTYSDLPDAGVSKRACTRLSKLAEFGEYWSLKLTMNPDGSVEAARFIKT